MPLINKYVELTLDSSVIFQDNEGQFHIFSYVTTLGHALIDRALYVPEDWCADLPRRHAAHIPDHLAFRTKPELAKQMVERAQSAGLPIGWVVADTVYGHSTDLRLWLEEQGYAYALAVPSIEVVGVQTHSGLLLSDVASIAKQALSARDWQRLSQSLGTKGERLFDWARLPIVQAGTVDGCHWLVIRRCLEKPDELAYYLVWSPPDTSLPTMVRAIGARWHIEEDLEAAKDLGLDHYEVRSYLGWYRHLTLVLLAYAFLVSICVQAQQASNAPREVSITTSSPPLIALSPSEVRHLLAHLIFPAPTCAPLICQGSWWRRTHQYWAGYASLVVVVPKLARACVSSQALLPMTFPGSSLLKRPEPFLGKTPGSFPQSSPVSRSFLLHPPYERSGSMTFVSLADACRHLSIDAKTLHRWLAEAQLVLQCHPHDGRKKGVSQEHLQVLARLHHRRLASYEEEVTAQLPGQIPTLPAGLLSLPEQLAAMQAQLVTLQQQVADLTRLISQHRPDPARQLPPTKPSSAVKPPLKPATSAPLSHPAASATTKTKTPAKPTHVIPRVEYGEEGHYVVICPKRGLLLFEPDTEEWFAWVREQDSFRFVGKQGYFTAHHEWRVPKGAWRAHRHIRNHNYVLRLAPNHELTIAVLEQAAEALQAHLM